MHATLCFRLQKQVPTMHEAVALIDGKAPAEVIKVARHTAAEGNRARHLDLVTLGQELEEQWIMQQAVVSQPVDCCPSTPPPNEPRSAPTTPEKQVLTAAPVEVARQKADDAKPAVESSTFLKLLDKHAAEAGVRDWLDQCVNDNGHPLV